MEGPRQQLLSAGFDTSLLKSIARTPTGSF